MSEKIENGERMRANGVKRGIAVGATAIAIGLSGASWAGCGDDESSTAATDATDAVKSDATDATDEAKETATDATDEAKSDAADAAEKESGN